MSFSGRRVSILPSSGRRFSVGKELSLNGESHPSSPLLRAYLFIAVKNLRLSVY